MTYSKIDRKAVVKRIIISWVMIAILSTLMGVAITQLVHGIATEKRTATPAPYGSDARPVAVQELPPDRTVETSGFRPVECDMVEEKQEFLYQLCEAYSLDFPLVMALIQTESAYEDTAVSPTNDYGLMQINRVNHAWVTDEIGVSNYLDPYDNMRAGCFILRGLFERYQDVNMVLMAYNMGESGAAKLWEHGVFSTDYTEKVLRCRDALKGGD